MKETDRGFKLSTGKEFYAYANLLSPDSGGKLAYGYDGRVSEKLTKAEKQEIADYMIARWQKWRPK